MRSSRLKRALPYVLIIVIAVAVIGLQLKAYSDYLKLSQRTSSSTRTSGNGAGLGSNNNSSDTDPNYIRVSMTINYGNNSITWFNQTRVPDGWNLYELTVYLTDGRVDSYYSFDLREHYVLAINGLEQRLPLYWSIWIYCQNDGAWTYSNFGADGVILSNNGIYGWYYQADSLPPVSGAKTVPMCSS